MGIAIDYAWQKPDIAQLLAAHVSDVFRYTGPESWGKTITQTEYDSLIAAGIRVWLVFEAGSNDSAGGINAGTANAHTALQHAPAGYTGPIWFACDESLSGSALSTAVDYIRGACMAMGGPEHTGVYGEGALVQAVHDADYARYYWQSDSTSFPGNAHTLPITQVQQGLNGPLPGTDIDRIVLPLINPQPTPEPSFDTDQMELLMSLAASKQDAFNAQIRWWWANYRTDGLTVSDINILWYAYNSPAPTGFGGLIDLVLANIIDVAKASGKLRPYFVGAV